MRWRGFLGSVFALTVVLAASAACSSNGTCSDGQCLAGNRCLALRGEVKCRKTCTSNSDPATSCPFGYTCTDIRNGGKFSGFMVEGVVAF